MEFTCNLGHGIVLPGISIAGYWKAFKTILNDQLIACSKIYQPIPIPFHLMKFQFHQLHLPIQFQTSELQNASSPHETNNLCTSFTSFHFSKTITEPLAKWTLPDTCKVSTCFCVSHFQFPLFLGGFYINIFYIICGFIIFNPFEKYARQIGSFRQVEI